MIPVESVYEFHQDELVSPIRGKLRAALESIFDEYVAPIHGNPVAGEDLPSYLETLIGAAERIDDEYTVPG